MPSALADLSASLADLAESIAPRLVGVEGADGRALSGFVWRTGLVVTANEGLEGEDEATIVRADGSRLAASITGRDATTDVALMSADTGEFGDWPVAPVPRPGSLAIVAGRGEHSVLSTLASVTEVGPGWRSMRGGEIDARISLGLRLSSRAEGAAAVAPDGTLIGLAVTGIRRRTLVIPAATVARSVATLSEKGYIPRGWLGVSLHPMGEAGGAIVVGVETDGPAARAGFFVGDIITTWNGEPVRSVAGVADRLTGAMIGAIVKMGVLRGGVASELDVAIGERPRG
jgi:S1-C subfamily serine protease